MRTDWPEQPNEIVSNGDVRIAVRVLGEGPAVMLLHGFPQHGGQWRHVATALADAGHRVIVPDMRGFGWSDKPLDGYEAEQIVGDLDAIVAAIGADRLSVVGHDLGAIFAAQWGMARSAKVERLVLIEAGFSGPPTWKGAPTWHGPFLLAPDLPEALISGREHAFVEHMLRQYSMRQTSFTDADVEAYASYLAKPGNLRGALAHMRAIPRNMAALAAGGRALPQPILAIGGALSYGAAMAEGLKTLAGNVRGLVAEESGHWVPEEQPEWLVTEILAFLSP